MLTFVRRLRKMCDLKVSKVWIFSGRLRSVLYYGEIWIGLRIWICHTWSVS
jgi:hypothetical protein